MATEPLSVTGDPEAASRRIVENPAGDLGEVVLDVDAEGHLLVIEFLDRRAVPPALLEDGPGTGGRAGRARQGSNLRPSA